MWINGKFLFSERILIIGRMNAKGKVCLGSAHDNVGRENTISFKNFQYLPHKTYKNKVSFKFSTRPGAKMCNICPLHEYLAHKRYTF